MFFKKNIRAVAVIAAVALAGTVTVYAAYDSSKDPIVSLSYLTEVFKPDVRDDLYTTLKVELAQAVNTAKNTLNTQFDSLKASISAQVDSAIKDFSTKSETTKNTLSAQLATDVAAAKAEVKAELKTELETKIEEDYSATIDAMQTQIDALTNVYEPVTLEKGQRLMASAACEIVLLSGSATVRSSAADSGIIDCTEGVILYDGQSAPANHKLLVPDNGDGRGLSCTGTAQLLVKGGYTIG